MQAALTRESNDRVQVNAKARNTVRRDIQFPTNTRKQALRFGTKLASSRLCAISVSATAARRLRSRDLRESPTDRPGSRARTQRFGGAASMLATDHRNDDHSFIGSYLQRHFLHFELGESNAEAFA